MAAFTSFLRCRITSSLGCAWVDERTEKSQMSLVMRRIKKELSTKYIPYLDVTGIKDEVHRLSRATAAIGIAMQSGVDPEAACRDVTDHGKDQGIDGVSIYANGSKLLLVQSKFTEGHGAHARRALQGP